MPAAIGLIAVGAAAMLQTMFGALVPSGWWMPDLLLVVTVLAVGSDPERALIASVIAGSAAAVLTARQSWSAGAAYLGVGIALRWVATRWNIADTAIQLVCVAVLESAIVAWWLVVSGHVTISLIGSAVLRVALTAAIVPFCRRAWRAIERARAS